MRLRGYLLSYGLAAPVGIAMGAFGGFLVMAVTLMVFGGGPGAIGFLELYVLAIAVVVGGLAGLAHGVAGMVGGVLGAAVAGTCPRPWRSRVMPAVAGAGVANVLGWSIALTVLTGSSGLVGDFAAFAAMAAICTALSAITAGVLVLADERRARRIRFA